MELFEPASKHDVVLIPVTSGRRIVDVIRTSFEAEITFDVEPTQDNLEPLDELARLLEPFKPDPWANQFDSYNPKCQVQAPVQRECG